jgi:hypothetical protein
MATKKNSVQSSSTNSRPHSGSRTQSKTKQGDSASSMILQLIGGVVGDNLSESVSHLKNRVTEQVAIHGEEYLESARHRITEATDKVIEWGKKHPVKTVAAAAALIAVSGFLYATLHDKTAQGTKKVVAKMKEAAAKA